MHAATGLAQGCDAMLNNVFLEVDPRAGQAWALAIPHEAPLAEILEIPVRAVLGHNASGGRVELL